MISNKQAKETLPPYMLSTFRFVDPELEFENMESLFGSCARKEPSCKLERVNVYGFRAWSISSKKEFALLDDCLDFWSDLMLPRLKKNSKLRYKFGEAQIFCTYFGTLDDVLTLSIEQVSKLHRMRTKLVISFFDQSSI